MIPSAPTVTMADINNKVRKATYTILPDCTTTICQLTLENGFTVIGKSACVCVENFNVALGEKYAYEDAVRQIWQLEGYLLRETIYRGDENQYLAEQNEAKYKLLEKIRVQVGADFFENIPTTIGNLQRQVSAPRVVNGLQQYTGGIDGKGMGGMHL